MNRRILFLILALLTILSCNFIAPRTPTPPSGLFATLQASTSSGDFTPSPPALTATSAFGNFPTIPPTTANNSNGTSVPFATSADGLTGHIVFTCQIYKIQASNQVCIMNADGAGWRALTTDNSRQHWYPSLSPDGQSVIYSAFLEANVHEIYELTLTDGNVTRLTNKLGVLTAAEVSPDGGTITFTRWSPNSNRYQIYLMNRNGTDPNNIPGIEGWDPTWSPDGNQILYASNESGSNQLYAVKANGKSNHQISNLPAIRGRSDWSPDGQFIVTYSGESWHREIYLMNADGSNTHQITPTGGNSQGPSFSPDGQWIAFTAYFDHYGDDHGCEIYVMHVDGTNLRRLTNNDYCDYQPRWGP